MMRFGTLSGARTVLLASLGSFLFAAACSSGSDSHPAAVQSQGGSSSGGSSATQGGSSSSQGGGSAAHGGSNSDAGDGAGGDAQAGAGPGSGNAGEGGAGGEQPGMIIDVPPSACSEKAAWAGAAPVNSVSTDLDERLLSVTADELDLAFLREGALYLAHRAKPSDDFADATAVTVPDGYTATAGAALSADGKTLALVASDGKSFAQITRSSRTGDFATVADPTPFAGLNARAVQTLQLYAAPVFAPDGKSFLFSARDAAPSGAAGVYESLWSGKEWNMPSNVSYLIFDGTPSARPLPNALSSDSRTLFYFDEADMQEKARFRDRPDAPLYDEVDLGGRQNAVPNAACNRIYYSSAGNVLTESD